MYNPGKKQKYISHIEQSKYTYNLEISVFEVRKTSCEIGYLVFYWCLKYRWYCITCLYPFVWVIVLTSKMPLGECGICLASPFSYIAFGSEIGADFYSDSVYWFKPLQPKAYAYTAILAIFSSSNVTFTWILLPKEKVLFYTYKGKSGMFNYSFKGTVSRKSW
jgi:hypothetical protein